MKNILFVAAESAPFIKTGGLGSVLGSLPKELNKCDAKVSVVIPGYECIAEEYKEAMVDLMTFPVKLNWRESYVTLAKLVVDGVDCYFIKNDMYYCGPSPYNDIWLDIEKFAFFSKAVLEMLSYTELPVDIIHCHDWQTGLLPVFLRSFYGHDPYFKRMKSIITIHNLKFQGICDVDRMKDITGLPDEAFTFDRLENYGNANMLKGAIAYADYVTTVSETYAEEITTVYLGEGLNQAISARKDALCGIVNGIDWDSYNPETDPYVASHYNIDNYAEKRPANKRALQELTGLPVDEEAFTMGIVSRLTEQKGYDLMDGSLEGLLDQGAQLFILGSGEHWVEEIFLRYQKKYPDQIYMNNDYADKYAKAIYAGCDITLMPSRFEPCGLNQLMALRYGCLPLVRETGGLKDTVSDDRELSANGTGFVFSNYSGPSFFHCLDRAYTLYKDYPELWKERIKKGMEEDFSWAKSAQAYIRLYESL